MPVLSAYRQVLSKPGAAAFSASGFLARLPISMVTLGIVLLISARTDSYGLAGGISAAFVIASCLAALLQGRLIDRLGPGQGARCPAVLDLHGQPLAAGLGGRGRLPGRRSPTSSPPWPAPPCPRWVPRSGPAGPTCSTNPAERQTAFALEAVVDECIFLSGPPLATVLATTVDPAAGLVAAIVFGLVGTLVFCSLRSTEPPRAPGPHDDGVKVAMPWRLTAPGRADQLRAGRSVRLHRGRHRRLRRLARRQGDRRRAARPVGARLARSPASSPARSPGGAGPATRMRLGVVVALTALMAPTPLIGSSVAMGVLLFLAGFAIAPTLIGAVSFIEQTVPASRLTEGIAMLHTTMAAGIAPGAADRRCRRRRARPARGVPRPAGLRAPRRAGRHRDPRGQVNRLAE